MGALADGRLEGRVPGLTMGVFEWLLEEVAALRVRRGAAGSAEGSESVESAEGAESAEAAASTEGTASVKPTELSEPDAWVAGLMAGELLIRRLQAAQMRALVAAVETVPAARRRGARADQDPGDPASSISSSKLVSSRLAPELNCHPLSTAAEVETALGLVHDLPRIFALLEQGRLDAGRARLITRKLHTASETRPQLKPGNDAWLLLEAMVAAQAPDLTRRDLERLILRLLLQLDPDGGNERHVQAMRSRHVQVEAQPDGMALITALVSAEAGQLLDGFLDAAADAARDRAEEDDVPDGRTHEHRRADVLAALVQALSEGVHIPLVPDPRNEARDDESVEEADQATNFDQPSQPETPGRSPSPSSRPDPPDGEPESADDEEPETRSTEPVPDSFRRRAEEDSQPATVDHHNGLGDPSFPPVPQGTIPAWWRIPDLPRAKGRGVHLVVTITDTTLLGLDQSPGLLQGHGVISAEHARRLAVAPGQVTLMVLPGACTHGHDKNSSEDGATASTPCPVGLDHEQPQARRYRPGRTLTNQVAARYPECTFPGCGTPPVAVISTISSLLSKEECPAPATCTRPAGGTIASKPSEDGKLARPGPVSPIRPARSSGPPPTAPATPAHHHACRACPAGACPPALRPSLRRRRPRAGWT